MTQSLPTKPEKREYKKRKRTELNHDGPEPQVAKADATILVEPSLEIN